MITHTDALMYELLRVRTGTTRSTVRTGRLRPYRYTCTVKTVQVRTYVLVQWLVVQYLYDRGILR